MDLEGNLNKNASKVDKDYASLMFDVKYDKEQFKDPETIGLLMYRLAREREKTNALFAEILEKLEGMKNALEKTGKPAAAGAAAAAAPPDEEVLADIDKDILTFVKKHGKIDAEEVQRQFNYKGKNAASARLNALYRRRLLKKGRAGKKVLYWI